MYIKHMHAIAFGSCYPNTVAITMSGGYDVPDFVGTGGVLSEWSDHRTEHMPSRQCGC